ncbi:hypothetical protein DXG01_008909 [Tephrocybe rancida]|nr:hypothetical protein DXG01_008909 [Tephrocybe rancida]
MTAAFDTGSGFRRMAIFVSPVSLYCAARFASLSARSLPGIPLWAGVQYIRTSKWFALFRTSRNSFSTASTSEEYLGKIDWKGKDLKLETKLYPTVAVLLPTKKFGGLGGAAISHSPEDLRTWLTKSLHALNADSIEMWYLHGPDRTVPYEVTLKAVNDLYNEGLFKRFGISNYTAWEVAEMVSICKTNGYVQPTVYQGIYNVVHRAVEPELLPCLRKFGIAFYAFNPLGGGLFTGRYSSLEEDVEAGSRFDPNKFQGQNYRKRYWNEPYFDGLAAIRKAAEAHNLSLPEVALRWISHHSLLKREHGDAVLIGASSLEHIGQNLVDFEKGPLPDDVVKALDEAWLIVKPRASQYFH